MKTFEVLAHEVDAQFAEMAREIGDPPRVRQDVRTLVDVENVTCLVFEVDALRQMVRELDNRIRFLEGRGRGDHRTGDAGASGGQRGDS